jgi:hypothetical protein
MQIVGCILLQNPEEDATEKGSKAMQDDKSTQPNDGSDQQAMEIGDGEDDANVEEERGARPKLK